MNRLGVLILVLMIAGPAFATDKPKGSASVRTNGSLRIDPSAEEPPAPVPKPAEGANPLANLGSLAPSPDDFKGLRSVALIGLISLAPAALLMFTSFVRINNVLIFLRQALG